MKPFIIKSLSVVALVSVQSFAIFGLGGHYAANLGSELSGSTETVFTNTGPDVTVTLNESSASPLRGFGFKFWIDALPFVDVMANFNIQGVLYDAELQFDVNGTLDTLPITIDPGIPGIGDADPAFGMMSGDLSVVYPFLKLPPLVNIIQFHGGAGLSMVYSKKIVTRSAVEAALQSQAANLTSGTVDPNAVVDAVVADLTDASSFEQGMGAHLIVGARAKLPVIPIAVYLDGKYQLGGSLPSSVSSGFILEIGGGIAF